ncbi:MAG: hypothetical protein H0W83_13390, partial [Planctomycetes bacterium]|nr:hypothetical protein [Planctomycetota bacterium]
MTASDQPLDPAQRALAVRLPNWVGDVCMALPALAALRSAGRELHCFGKGWAIDLLSGMGDRVEKLPSGIRAGARAVAASGCGSGILFTNSLGSALVMRLGGVRATGYRGECRSLLLGTALRRARGAHEVETFWRLALAHLGIEGRSPPRDLG